jgi:hypothetical protein
MAISCRKMMSILNNGIGKVKPQKVSKNFWPPLYPVNSDGYIDNAILYPFSVQSFVPSEKAIFDLKHFLSNKTL